MSCSINFCPPTLSALLLGLLTLFGQAGCSIAQPTAMAQVPEQTSNDEDALFVGVSDLMFAGQIEGEDGRWLNDYVVVLFRNGEEVARTTSSLQDSRLSSAGPMDGVFELHTPNVYQLNLGHEFYYPDRTLAPMKSVPGAVDTRTLGTWCSDLNPADIRVIAVPAKQLEYALVVLALPHDELSERYNAGNLSLRGGILVIETEEEEKTAVPDLELTPLANIQFTVLSPKDNELTWTLQMTGFYGSRWDVWERFLIGRVPGLSWETFKESVLVYNPHLETDSFVFYPDKVYLLPINQ